MKESKNLGITKSCPKCRKTLIKSILFSGEGSFETKCPHCNEFVCIKLTQKNYVLITTVALSLTVLVVVGSYLFVNTSGIMAQLIDGFK